MSFFISDAMAETGTQQGDPMMSLLFFGGLFLIMYLMIIRPQSKRMKEHKNMVAALGKGDEIVTNGGILGKIVNIGDMFLTVEVAEGIELKIQREMVAALMPKGTIKDANK
ncbi:MAG: preprotein translocase subunit YajC [Gammaproteobacteria bacterium]|nr:preprotein translocase subunit YajC [Gammaproteobacteria bacterium]